jgi:flagellin
MVASTSKTSQSLINSLSKNREAQTKNFRRLSEGKKNVFDDAAAVAIAKALEAENGALKQAKYNSSNGQSVIDAQQSALDGVTGMVTRRKELALQASNGTLSDTQRASLNEEYVALGEEIDRQISTASFNGRSVFNNPEGTDIQVGTDSSAASRINIPSIDTSSIDTSGDILTASNALAQVDAASTQLQQVSSVVGSLGASASRLEAAESNIEATMVQNARAQSALEDIDVAQEFADLVANRIREQGAAGALRQHNLNAEQVVSLIQGVA